MSGEKNRHFGNIRRLSSGRYQVRYRGPDGKLRSAPNTFGRKSDASKWLSIKDTEITQGDWIAPELAKILFGEYAQDWKRDRVLKVCTQELYLGLLRNHSAHRLVSRRACTGASLAPGAVRVGRPARSGLHRPQRRPTAPVELSEVLEQGAHVCRSPRSAFSRSPTYRRHTLGGDRREPQGADGAARALQRAGGDDLPARHEGP